MRCSRWTNTRASILPTQAVVLPRDSIGYLVHLVKNASFSAMPKDVSLAELAKSWSMYLQRSATIRRERAAQSLPRVGTSHRVSTEFEQSYTNHTQIIREREKTNKRNIAGFMNYDLPSVLEKLREAMRQQGPTVPRSCATHVLSIIFGVPSWLQKWMQM